MKSISAVIITYNEEENIRRCLKSLIGLADEIIVVDSFSTDSTPDICREEGVKFIQHRFDGYRQQKDYATDLAKYDLILSLDADEALSTELYRNIMRVKESQKFDGYYMNRRNNYCGTWIKHSNWYPDRKIRLFDRRNAVWGGINPHDRIIMKEGASLGRLKGDLLHWTLGSYEEHIDKVNKFTTIAALEYYKSGKRASVSKMLFHGVWRFLKTYFMRRGFLDGYNGFVISTLSAYTSFLKYLKLRQLNLYGVIGDHSEEQGVGRRINGKNREVDNEQLIRHEQITNTELINRN